MIRPDNARRIFKKPSIVPVIFKTGILHLAETVGIEAGRKTAAGVKL
jgi:hypothetical protein